MRTCFEPAKEAMFGADYAERTLQSVRFGFVLGGVLYGLFALLDLWMLPHSWRGAHLIRFGVVIPGCLAAIVSTFFPVGEKHLQGIASSFVIVAGLGIVGMIVLAGGDEPGFRYYYAGLLLVLTYSFAVLRLRFLATAVCCLVIIAVYLFVAVFDQHLLEHGLFRGSGPVFLNNGYFLLGAGIITLMGSYLLEEYARKDFLLRDELGRALDVIQASQTQLIQTERTAAMANVVAGLLHELNTPIGVIASASDVLSRGVRKLKELRGAPSSTEQKAVHVIDDNVQVLGQATSRVTSALDVLKRFTRLDQADTAQYDINEALEDCLSLLAHEMGERIVVKKNFAQLPSVRCHPAEINQLFMSLIQNAVEAIPSSGTIHLSTAAEEGSVRVDISDTGVGIEEHRMKELFAPRFSRGGSRVKTGLGLVTAQSIVQQHGGTLEIESEVGKGTHVLVRFPTHRREDA